MFRRLEKEEEKERGQRLAQKQSSSGTPGPVRGYWDGREPMEDESELALELAQLKWNEIELPYDQEDVASAIEWIAMMENTASKTAKTEQDAGLAQLVTSAETRDFHGIDDMFAEAESESVLA